MLFKSTLCLILLLCCTVQGRAGCFRVVETSLKVETGQQKSMEGKGYLVFCVMLGFMPVIGAFIVGRNIYQNRGRI